MAGKFKETQWSPDGPSKIEKVLSQNAQFLEQPFSGVPPQASSPVVYDEIPNQFEDCPYHCDNGRVFNPFTREYEPCPACADKKQALIKGIDPETKLRTGQDLKDLLGFTSRNLDEHVTISALIPPDEQKYIEEESITKIEEAIKTILKYVDTYSRLPNSYCFGLGIKGDIEKFAFLLLARAYRAGYSISRFLSISEIHRWNSMDKTQELEDLVNKDLALILLPDGFRAAERDTAKGIMQQRGIKGHATIFLTTWKIESVSGLLNAYNNPDMLTMARPVFVEYKSKKSSHSNYINNLTGMVNESVID